MTLLAHQNTGKENRYRKRFFATLISTLGRFNRANKKKSVVYTLRLSWLNSYTKLMQTSSPLHFVEFDSSRALEIHDVARAVSCIACTLEMRSSDGRKYPKQSYSCVVYLDKEAWLQFSQYWSSPPYICSKDELSFSPISEYFTFILGGERCVSSICVYVSIWPT